MLSEDRIDEPLRCRDDRLADNEATDSTGEATESDDNLQRRSRRGGDSGEGKSGDSGEGKIGRQR